MENTYTTHSNGGRPFKVIIKEKGKDLFKVKVFAVKYDSESESSEDEDCEESYQYYFIGTYLSDKVIIGKSPLNRMTEWSGGHGPEADGNSLIFRNYGKDTYVYLGNGMYTFKPLSDIEKYISPVGPNDVPYPYAIDKEGNHYLMIEGVIIRNTKDNRDKLDSYKDNYGDIDPYSHYYDYSYITATQHNVPHPPKIERFMNIEEFYEGDEIRCLHYVPKDLDFPEDEKIYIKYYGSDERVEVTEDTLKDIAKAYGDLLSFEGIETIGSCLYPSC